MTDKPTSYFKVLNRPNGAMVVVGFFDETTFETVPQGTKIVSKPGRDPFIVKQSEADIRKSIEDFPLSIYLNGIDPRVRA